MSSAPNPTFATAATYQSIIIALVAASILTAVIMSIAYRRRRRRLFLLQVARARGINEGESRWVELADGTVVHVRGTKKRKDYGSIPRLWDFELGEGSSHGIERALIDEDLRNEKQVEVEDEDEEEEIDVGGFIGSRWNPVAATFTVKQDPTPASGSPRSSISTSTSPSHNPSHSLNMSVLIAMPSPYTHPASPSPLPSALPSTQPPSYPSHHHLDPHSDQLPVVEIGSTEIPIYSSSDQSTLRSMVERMKEESSLTPSRSGDDSSGGGVRVERTDGFRTA